MCCRTVEDFEDWTNWLFYKGGVAVKTDNSWEAWWVDEHVSRRFNHKFRFIYHVGCGLSSALVLFEFSCSLWLSGH